MSGSPVGHCPICEETIYECEWQFTGDIMHHEDCKVTKFVSIFAKLPIDEQKRILECAKTITKSQLKELANSILEMCEKMEGD